VRRWIVVFASTLLVVLPLLPALADDDDPSVYSEPSVYVGLQGLVAIPNLDTTVGSENDRGTLGPISSDGVTGGLTARAGTRPIRWLAIELVFDWTENMRAKVVGSGTTKFSTYVGTANFKVFPLHWLLDGVLDGRLQPYLEAGPSLMGASGTGIGTPIAFAGRVGIGADFHINQRWAVGLESSYSMATRNLSGLDYVTVAIGASYRFR